MFKVLAIDDCELNLRLIEEILGNKYRVITANSGIEGFEHIEKEPPDIILLDILMQKMNGYQVLDELKNNAYTKDIPVIMVTALTENQEVRKAISQGALDYIKKPVDPTELHYKVASTVKIRQQEKKIRELKGMQQDNMLANIQESMLYARRIQDSVLPGKAVIKKHFPESFVLYIPRDIISGDFYWINETGQFKLIGAFDCTGHGIPGAMLSMMGYSLLNEIVNIRKICRPADILACLGAEINKNLNRSADTYVNYDGMDAALCAIHHDNKVEFSGSRRPLLIISPDKEKLRINDKTLEACHQINGYSMFEIKSNKVSLGRESQQETFDSYQIKLEKDDIILLSSDGFINQLGEDRGKTRKYSSRRARNMLIRNIGSGMEHTKTHLYNSFLDWKGKHEQTDDILIIGIKLV